VQIAGIIFVEIKTIVCISTSIHRLVSREIQTIPEAKEG